MFKAWLCSVVVLAGLGWSGDAYAELTVTPDPIDFGNVSVAGGASTIAEQIDSDSVVPEVLASITVTGSGCSVVTVTPPGPPPWNIDSATPLPIDIAFDPVNRDAVTCTVELRDAGSALLGSFQVTGDGAAPVVSAPASTSFGTVRVTGTATANQDVVIENTGEETLSISNLTISGTEFTFTTPPAFPIDIAPGTSGAVTITFDPSTSGDRSETLTITSNDPATPMAAATLAGIGGNAIIAVDDVSFGDVTDGTTATADITVTNTGTPPATLTVASATITGGSWFTFADNGAGCTGQTSCTFTGLTVGATPQTVAVRCSPVASDPMVAQNAAVTFTSDSDGGDSVALLTCIAGRANIDVGTSLAFGDVRAGTSSAPQTVTVRNTGNRDLTYSAAASGTFASRYTLGGSCHTGCTVAPTAMETFTVTFAPDAAQQMDIDLVITNNDPDGSPATVAVTGRGVLPAISGPPSVAFGSVEVGATSGALPLTITNTGTSDLTIASAVVQTGTGDYAVTSGSPGTQVIAPNGTATWDLTCTPQGQGARPGTFRITSDAPNAPQLDVPLTCTGTRGFLVVVPATLAFGGVAQDATATLDVTLHNTGNLAVTGIAAAVNPATAGYSVVAGLPASLAANTSATVTIRFAPTATAAGGNATVTFDGVWGTGSTATAAVLAVSGTRLSTGYTVSRASIDFGDFRFDQQPTRTFCITNDAEAAVTIQSPISFVPSAGTASSEFAITDIKRQTTCGTGGTSVTLPQTLATSEVLEVTVRAQPANRTGPLAGDLHITSDLPSNPNRTVALTANAITAMLAVVPGATVSFGDVDIQGAPVMTTVRLRNTGQAALDLGSFTRTANAAFTFTLPGDTTLPPNGEISIQVTYAPTVALATEETVTITHSIAGDITAPAIGMIVLRGHPIDRDLEIVGGVPLFPDTFRNPGTAGPVRIVTIRNAGQAPLQIASVSATRPEVWKVLDPDPITIPTGASMDVRVRFEPTLPGLAEAALQIVSDDADGGPPITPSTTEVQLSGNCVDRRVSFNPTTIDLGYVEIGETYTIPEVLVVRSMDEANTFTIQRIAIDGGDGAFSIDGKIEGVTLDRVAMERRFDVTFTPTVAGAITAKAQLFLDQDPVHQSEIELQGTAVFVDARGGGGCATGHGGGAGAIALVLAAVLATRRRFRGAAALAAVLGTAPAARAEDDILLSVFEPTPQTSSDGFQLQSPVVGPHGTWAGMAVFSYAADPLLHVPSSGGEQGVITGSTMVELGAAVALLGKFELGVAMPFYSQTGEALGDRNTGYTAPPADGTATGDLRVHGKVGLVRRALAGNGSFALAGSISLTIPTATDGMLTGVDDPSARMLALAALVPGAFGNRVTLSGNFGAIVRAPSAYKNLEQKSGFAWGLGASVRVADPLWVAGEMYGELVPRGRATMDGSSKVLSPTEWLAGLRWRPDRRFMLSLAAGRGLTSAAGAPALRGVLAFTFTPMAPALRPIHAPPPPKPDVDSDADGVVDRLDRCPEALEDMDLFEDTDGCPDLDNDGDGVPDDRDRCALDPEDKDGFEDDDGCPEPDNDRDNILDRMDRCPNEPEDKDGFQDADGCPEPDNDRDGVLDAQDHCPNERETINGNQDDDGCPDKGVSLVLITLDRIDLMEAIQFTRDKLRTASYNLLGQLGATLRAHPEILRVRIAVHVGASGNDDRDQALSDRRAQAIREWLVQWGIAATRLDVRGFGSTKPLGGPPAADERVEIVIMEKT